MKTKLIFLVLLIVCFSCGTNNKPVSVAQKEKIKGEVKEVVNTIFRGFEEADFDKALEPFLDSPDFVLQGVERTYSYKEFMDMKPYFKKSILNEKHTLVDEKYEVLNNSTAIYSSNSKWVINYKDGHSSLADPEVMMLMFKKIDSRWRVTYYVDVYTEKIVKSKEPSKGIDQFELHKKFVGIWKCDYAEDTTLIYDIKSYGIGFEGFQKFVSKGKIVAEDKRLCGYNKNLDKYIFASVDKEGGVWIIAEWFTSINKLEGVDYNDNSNPDKASWKFDVEFKSPDIFVTTYLIDNKPVATKTYTRLK